MLTYDIFIKMKMFSFLHNIFNQYFYTMFYTIFYTINTFNKKCGIVVPGYRPI